MNIYTLFEKSVLAEKTFVEVPLMGDIAPLVTWGPGVGQGPCVTAGPSKTTATEPGHSLLRFPDVPV